MTFPSRLCDGHRSDPRLWAFFFFFKIFFGFSSVAQSCLTPCNCMDCSTPGLPVHHQILEFTQTHVHWVSDAIHPFHPLSSHFFKHLYWICYSIASVSYFVFFCPEACGILAPWPRIEPWVWFLCDLHGVMKSGSYCLLLALENWVPPVSQKDLFEHRGDLVISHETVMRAHFTNCLLTWWHWTLEAWASLNSLRGLVKTRETLDL